MTLIARDIEAEIGRVSTELGVTGEDLRLLVLRATDEVHRRLSGFVGATTLLMALPMLSSRIERDFLSLGIPKADVDEVAGSLNLIIHRKLFGDWPRSGITAFLRMHEAYRAGDYWRVREIEKNGLGNRRDLVDEYASHRDDIGFADLLDQLPPEARVLIDAMGSDENTPMDEAIERIAEFIQLKSRKQ